MGKTKPMKLITRDVIHKEIKLSSLRPNNDGTVKETVIDYVELCSQIDRNKEYLVNVKKVKPGQKVILCTLYWPSYASWFFACSELGLVFVVSDWPKSDIARTKLSLYGEIDYIIQDLKMPLFSEWWPEKIIEVAEVEAYNPTGNPTPIWVNPTDVLLLATSSGTTGTPKVIPNTHEWFYNILHRAGKLYNLTEEDNCYHSKPLHHGSVCGMFFLPSLKYSKNHFHAPFKFMIPEQGKSWEETESFFIRAWVNWFQEKKITRTMLFPDQIEYLNKYISYDNKRENNLTIYCLSKIKKEEIENLVAKFKYKMISIFGANEIGGPLFLPAITPDNYTSFNPSFMGPKLDDFYDLEIVEGMLITTRPDGIIVSTGDKFKLVDGNYYYLGRENVYRIDGKTIYMDLFNEVVEKILKQKKEDDFDLVIDSEEETFYIRVNTDVDLEILNDEVTKQIGMNVYNISKKIIGHRTKYFASIKFDPETIRIECRRL